MTKKKPLKSSSNHPRLFPSHRRSQREHLQRHSSSGNLARRQLSPPMAAPEAMYDMTFSSQPEHTPPATSNLSDEHLDMAPESARKQNGSRPWPLRVLSHWLFWMTVSIAVTGGVAGFAGATLFKIPSLPNCPKIFWPTASAALRMQCAELAASKNTTKDLLEAIDLVDDLPDSHPMRQQVDGLIERWALDILQLADISFHNGDLDGAIASAQRVPNDLQAYEKVTEKIERWRSIWAKAEKIYKDSEDFLEKEDLRGAFAIAVKLLNVGNDYWETDQYESLTELIKTSRIDTEKLGEARRLAKAGNVSSLLDAIHLVEEIQPKSRIYPPARRALSRFLESLVDLGVKALGRGDSDTAMQVSRNLPSGVEFQAKARDLKELSFALAQAKSGTVEDMEAAIVQAEALNGDRPLYQKAQQLISRWELEIQDVRQLTRARQLASLGQIPNLQEAIAEAKLVGNNNPRSDEARSAIRQWTRQIQTLEDRPYLRNARQLAERGDVQSLDVAIQNASRISEGRPLYEEASRLANNWTKQMQSIQDQPYLDDAEQFASQGNLPAAIAAAQQVGVGRSLYNEAQSNIRQWQSQFNGDIFLQEAYDAARQGTPTAWSRAIRIADRIAAGHENRPEANRLMNQWSQNILLQAQQTANVDYGEAIAIARMVPTQTDAYAAAQLQIEAWQRAIAQQEQWTLPEEIIPTPGESTPLEISEPENNPVIEES
ncbi:MAG: chromosome segregation ATPase [Cyanobacteria bacterium P01_F01_bin.150]